MNVSLRFSVLERDGFQCQFCGTKAPDAELHVDHLTPISAGGSDQMDNLVAACKECNQGKGARLLSEPTDNEDLKAKQAHLAERLNILCKCDSLQAQIMEEKDEEAWKIARHWEKFRGGKPDKQGLWSASHAILLAVRSMLTRMTFEDVLACADITLARMRESEETHAIRYMYAVAKNRDNLVGDTER